jgi:hypothetical protein
VADIPFVEPFSIGTRVRFHGRRDGPHDGTVEGYAEERGKTWCWVRFAWGRTLVDPMRLTEVSGE